MREKDGVVSTILNEGGAGAEVVRAELTALQRGAGGAVEWEWRTLARDIDRAEARPEPSGSVLALTLRQVSDAVTEAQDGAVADQDAAKARQLTKLRNDVLEIARWVQAVLEQDPAQPG